MNTSSPAERIAAGTLESVPCYDCGSWNNEEFLFAQDDLTGRPGLFRFVQCRSCGLVYQNPRLTLEAIKGFYDDQYISHRKQRGLGPFHRLLGYALDSVDRRKERLLRRYARLDSGSAVLDAGCGAGTFLRRIHERFGSAVAGVDLVDLSLQPTMEGIPFRCGLFYDQDFAPRSFDLITMWHFLEHDYDPLRSLAAAHCFLRDHGLLLIEVPRLDSLSYRLFGHRWPGLQAPQHTVLFSRQALLRLVVKAGFEIADYLPYGAFPAYFYFYTGMAFKLLKGRGLNVRKTLAPYFAGHLLFWPIFVFERKLNFGMQTVVCRKNSR